MTVGFPRGSAVKNPPARVQSLGGEDPLEKEMATHSSTLAWENPMGRGAQRATGHGVAEWNMTEPLNNKADLHNQGRLPGR